MMLTRSGKELFGSVDVESEPEPGPPPKKLSRWHQTFYVKTNNSLPLRLNIIYDCVYLHRKHYNYLK